MRVRKARILIDCACGCGEQLENLDKKARPRRYISTHFKNRYWLGKKFSKQHRAGIKQARTIQEITLGSPAFKGGRSKMTTGYIRIWMPDHPYSSKAGHILEHRLVMEKVLGRYLKPEETIHHKNHIRDDNRIENLELYASQCEHLSIGHKHRK